MDSRGPGYLFKKNLWNDVFLGIIKEYLWNDMLLGVIFVISILNSIGIKVGGSIGKKKLFKNLGAGHFDSYPVYLCTIIASTHL